MIQNIINNNILSMNETLAEEQQSFSKKLQKIQRANNQLNQLERKMNMHFQANKMIQNRSRDLFEDNFLDDLEKNKHTEKRMEQPLPRHTNVTHKPFMTENNNQNYYEASKSDKKFGNVILTETNFPKEKKSENFKLFPRAKSHQQRQQSIQTSNDAQIRNTQGVYNLQSSYKVPDPEIQYRFNREEERIKKQNSFLSQLQSMQQLMKEKINSKQQRIQQLEQQIMNENEERVYLYKVNVRLEEQLKFLQQDFKIKQKPQNPMLGFRIKKIQADIEKTKQQIHKRKLQKKQLLREQQTLKDGYKIVIENCKGLVNKQAEREMQNSHSLQKRDNQNEKMLKKLMGDLQRLKGLVEDRVKDVENKKNTKRRVVKSYKA